MQKGYLLTFDTFVNCPCFTFQGIKGTPGAYGAPGDKGKKGVKGTTSILNFRQMGMLDADYKVIVLNVLSDSTF